MSMENDADDGIIHIVLPSTSNESGGGGSGEAAKRTSHQSVDGIKRVNFEKWEHLQPKEADLLKQIWVEEEIIDRLMETTELSSDEEWSDKDDNDESADEETIDYFRFLESFKIQILQPFYRDYREESRDIDWYENDTLERELSLRVQERRIRALKGSIPNNDEDQEPDIVMDRYTSFFINHNSRVLPLRSEIQEIIKDKFRNH